MSRVVTDANSGTSQIVGDPWSANTPEQDAEIDATRTELDRVAEIKQSSEAQLINSVVQNKTNAQIDAWFATATNDQIKDVVSGLLKAVIVKSNR
jgi:hypothetical protein